MADVFISYSRKDIAFARILHDSIKGSNLDTWIDWEDIPPSADWLEEVYRAIEEADTFLYIVSRASIRSEICGLEIACAIKNHKRIVPIVLHGVDPKEIPPSIAALNWIYFSKKRDSKFQEAFDTLLKTLQTDLGRVKEHTRLQVRALEWIGNQRSAGFLMRGDELGHAEHWLELSGEREPRPTAAQIEYILASRINRRRQRLRLIAAISLGLVVTVALSVLAVAQNNQEAAQRVIAQTQKAESGRQSSIALARQLAGQADLLRQQDTHSVQLSALLAVESLKRFPTLEGDTALRTDLSLMPQLQLKTLVSPYNINGGDPTITSLAFSPDGKWLAAGSLGQVLTIWDTNTWNQRRILTGTDPTTGVLLRVWCLAFSPDSRYLAAGLDGGVLIWNVADNKEIARFGSGQIFSLAFTPDSKQLAYTGDDTVTVSDPETGESSYTLKGGGNVVRISPDGNLGAAGGSNSTVVWDMRTGKVLVTKTQILENANSAGTRLSIQSLAFSPDGKKIATGERIMGFPSFPRVPASGEILVWEATTGNDITKISLADETLSMEFSSDGKRLAASNANSFLYLWDAVTGAQLEAIQTGSIATDLIFLNDGPQMAYITDSGLAIVVDSQTGAEIARMPTEVNNMLVSIAGSGSPSSIAVGDDKGNVWVWKLMGQEITKAGMGRNLSISSVAFSPDGTKILVGANDGTARIVDVVTGKIINSITHTSQVLIGRFSPDGQFVASGSQDGKITVWNPSTGKQLFQFTVGNMLGDLIFSPDSKFLAASEGSFPRDAWFIYQRQPEGRPTDVIIWELSSGKEIARFPHPSLVNSLAFSPDGQRIAAAGDDKIVHLWEIASRKEILQIPQQTRVNLVTFSPDGKRGASVGSCFPTLNSLMGIAGLPCIPSIEVWDVATGKAIWHTQLPAPWVGNLIFSPDGKWLATTNDYTAGCPTNKCESVAQVWDAVNGQPVSKMVHGDIVIALAFSQDGRKIASGGSDGILRIWDPASGEELSHITGVDSPWSASFSPDGHSIAVGGGGFQTGESYLRILPLQPDDLIRMACSRLTRNLTSEEWKQYLGSEPFQLSCSNLVVKDPGRPDGPSVSPVISPDSTFVIFQSGATNLVCGESNGHAQLYLYDLGTRQTRLISSTPDGQPADQDAVYPQISPDSRLIMFASSATNLSDNELARNNTSSMMQDERGRPYASWSERPLCSTGHHAHPKPSPNSCVV